MRCRPLVFLALIALTKTPFAHSDEKPISLQPGVRGLVTLVPTAVKIDGRLDEWTNAFCTPVHYNHGNLANRAAQFYYLWDHYALYVGLRALDKTRVNPAPLSVIADGDAVELYLDARAGEKLRGKEWTPGAVHLFFTPFEGAKVSPRWVVSQGIATSDIKLEGVEIAASTLESDAGYEVEFKIPWKNFPEFAPKPGSVFGIDAELCSSDGARRSDRTFAYGSPLSVQQPASLGLVELVSAFEPDYFAQVGPASFPIWVDTPWNQAQRALVWATIGVPPAFEEVVGEVEVRIHNADGAIVKTLKARPESFGPAKLGFVRAQANWSIDDYAPNTYFVTARVMTRTGKPITTVVPRLVEEAQMSGR